VGLTADCVTLGLLTQYGMDYEQKMLSNTSTRIRMFRINTGFGGSHVGDNDVNIVD
jgi:hypothetical protein